MELIKILTDKDIFGTDNFSTVAKPKPRTRGILLDSDGLIALIYAKDFGYYTIPGGTIEEGEDNKGAFLREMLEETGCQCKVLSELGYIIQLEQNPAKQNRVYISFCFLAQLVGEKGIPNWTESEKNQTLHIEWHTLECAIELIRQTEPSDYDSRFTRERNLLILKTAYNYLQEK
jgi:ADP-ribose pyrophosphatase